MRNNDFSDRNILNIQEQKKAALEYSFTKRIQALLENAKTDAAANEMIDGILLFFNKALVAKSTRAEDAIKAIPKIIDAELSGAFNEVLAFFEMKYR